MTSSSNTRYPVSYNALNKHDEVKTHEHELSNILWYDSEGSYPISLFLLPSPHIHTPKFHNDMWPWQWHSVTSELFPVFFQCHCFTSTVLPIGKLLLLRNYPTVSLPLQHLIFYKYTALTYAHSQCALHVVGSLFSCRETACPNHQFPVYVTCNTSPLLDSKVNTEG